MLDEHNTLWSNRAVNKESWRPQQYRQLAGKASSGICKMLRPPSTSPLMTTPGSAPRARSPRRGAMPTLGCPGSSQPPHLYSSAFAGTIIRPT